jgi:drug/metabolite transporter, DME family
VSTEGAQAPVLALAAALGFGVASIILRRGLVFIRPLPAAVASVSVTTVLAWVAAAATDGLAGLVTPMIVPFLIAGFLAPGLARLLVFVGYDRIGVSRATTLIAMAPLFSIAAAMVFLGEQPSRLVLVGAGLIVGGGVLLARRAPDDRSWRRRDMIFPVLGALGFAGRDAISRAALIAFPHPMLGAAAATLMSVSVMWLVTGVQHRSRAAVAFNVPGVALAALSGAFEGCAYLTMWRALAIGSVSVVSPLVLAYPLVTVVLALVFLRGVERVTWSVGVASGLTVVGVVFVMFGHAR